jgi:hypothetical protein
MPRTEPDRKLLELSHEVRNCSSALTMTLAGLKSGAGLTAPRTMTILRRCAQQLLAVSRALDGLAAADESGGARRVTRPRET